MKNVSSLINQIKQQQLLPLFYHDDPLICIEVTKALYAAGIRCIEFTNRGASALNNFTSIVAERDKNMQDLLLAVGTIRNPAQVHQFIDAGADFLISPFFEKNIYETVTSKKIFWIPGCMTPTEINNFPVMKYNKLQGYPMLPVLRLHYILRHQYKPPMNFH
jgi:2-dehydro-3-deoxyphosphogluconate aldolase/(4S)-4-hydroxy-2-oxoglutarate aldolase